jgi:uncharacterized membrane protein YedE/YeeE
MLMGELAMLLSRRGVILRVLVFAELMMMGRLMMVVRGGVVVSGGGLVMLARRMLGRFRHDFLLLPEAGCQPRLSLGDDP